MLYIPATAYGNESFGVLGSESHASLMLAV